MAKSTRTKTKAPALVIQTRGELETAVGELAHATTELQRLTAEMELVGAVTARDNFAAEIKELRAQLDAAQAERRGPRG